MSPSRTPPASPSAAEAGPDRVAAVDALRGAAMLGIVLVNFPTMNTLAGEETTAYGGLLHPIDRWVGGAGMLLLNGKFYPVFAALFGLGLVLASRSGAGPGAQAGRLATRRLLLLLAFGLLHLALVWWGDILVVYALLGLVTLPCLGWPPRRLLGVGLALLLLVPALSPLLALLDHLGHPAATWVAFPGFGLHLPSAEVAAATYQRGTFPEMLRQRALDYLSDFTPLAGEEVTVGLLAGYGTYYAQLLGLLLLGAWAGKAGHHLRLGADRAWTWRAWRVAAPAAALLTGLRVAAPGLGPALTNLQGNALALAYVLTFGLLLPRLSWARRPLEAVGRLSLSSYLAHTTLCSLLLYGTGLGLYGRIGPAALLPLSLATYALIALCALWWTRRYRLGPAEWAWRSLLHGAWLPLARPDP